MVKETIVNDALYLAVSQVVEPMGYQVVDAHKSEYGASVGISVTIKAVGHETTVDDCAAVYRVLYPRYSVTEAKRDVNLEISTPGIQRNLRDIHEFSLFSNRRCRIYDSKAGAWVEGVIRDSAGGNVILGNARFDDTVETIEQYVIPYERIQKAKLAYAWEDVPQCPTN
jgi:ribosome maturation factor RimP